MMDFDDNLYFLYGINYLNINENIFLINRDVK
jgi:hypothetical protein